MPSVWPAGSLMKRRRSAADPPKLVVGEISGAAGDQLFAAADSIKKKAGSYAVMLASAADGKVNFVAAVSDDLIAKGLKGR
jgi:alanyl-tRNA synthetase